MRRKKPCVFDGIFRAALQTARDKLRLMLDLSIKILYFV